MNITKLQLFDKYVVGNSTDTADHDREKELGMLHESIVYWLIHDVRFRQESIEFVAETLSDYPIHLRHIITILNAEYCRGKRATLKELRVLICNPQKYDIPEEEAASPLLESFLNTNVDNVLDLDFVREQLQPHLKESIYLEAASTILDGVKTRKIEELKDSVAHHMARIDILSTYDQDIVGIDYSSLIESTKEAKRRLSTGMVFVDCAMGGGLSRGELMTVLGRTKCGKSHYLTNMMYANIIKNHNVLYISFENGVQDIQRRFVSRASGIFYGQMRRVADSKVQGLMEDIRERTQYLENYGKHMIIHRQPYALTIRDLRGLMQRMEMKTGSPPDLIIIDYADYLGIIPEKGLKVESFDKHERVYYELASFAQENDIGIATVTQVNRTGAAKKDKNELITVEDTAKSFGKINASDYAFALNPMERESHYQYGYLQCLTSRSSAIQQFLFPYRTLLGMSYYESINVFDDGGHALFPNKEYQKNDLRIIETLRACWDEEMKNFAELLRPPLIEDQEELERNRFFGAYPDAV